MKLEKEARTHYISQNHQIGEVGHKITQAVITFVIDKELTCQESHFIDTLKNKEVKLIIEEKEPILDEVERKYLSDVIRPFRDRVKYIEKTSLNGKEYIVVKYYSIYKNCPEDTDICLPYFKKDTMYKGMELNKEYKLKDLGL